MASTKLDEIKAQNWIDDVNEEIRNVESILNRAALAMKDYPEKDTIIEEIMNTGEEFKTACNEVIKGLKTVSDDYVAPGIKAFFEKAKEVVEDWTNTKKSMNN